MIWKCPVCGAELPPEQAGRHVLGAHGGAFCSLCEVGFAEPKDYYRHLKEKHPEIYERLKEEARKHPEFYKKTLKAIEELERGESEFRR